MFVASLNESKLLNQKIVGGTSARSVEFPYQGLLPIRTSSIINILCGCVLIHSS